MALIENAFQPVGGQARKGASPQIWAYQTPDALATVKAAGYFNALRDRVLKDDFVICATSNGTTSVYTIIMFLLVPASPLATNVTVVTVDFSAA